MKSTSITTLLRHDLSCKLLQSGAKWITRAVMMAFCGLASAASAPTEKSPSTPEAAPPPKVFRLTSEDGLAIGTSKKEKGAELALAVATDYVLEVQRVMPGLVTPPPTPGSDLTSTEEVNAETTDTNEEGQPIIVHCELRETKVAYVITLPDITSLGPSNQQLLGSLGWLAAQRTMSRRDYPEGMQMAVALKGNLDYGAIFIGTVIKQITPQNDGVRFSDKGIKGTQKLQKFFVPEYPKARRQESPDEIKQADPSTIINN